MAYLLERVAADARRERQPVIFAGCRSVLPLKPPLGLDGAEAVELADRHRRCNRSGMAVPI